MDSGPEVLALDLIAAVTFKPILVLLSEFPAL